MSSANLKRRWYRLTPDRVLVCIILVESILWLSEELGSLPRNRHNGWPVLFAAAAAGATIVFASISLVACAYRRWRIQFSVRTLLMLTFAVAIACSWIVPKANKAWRQREAVIAIRLHGGDVRYSADAPAARCLHQNEVAEDCLGEVTEVTLYGAEGTDAVLEKIPQLDRLQWLVLGASDVTDAGLAHLEAIKGLTVLDLSNTAVTDAGLAHLTGLSELWALKLGQTAISDAGLGSLKELKGLQNLDIDFSKVTNQGVAAFHKALPDCHISR